MKSFATLLTIVVTLSCVTSSAHADRKSRLEEKARQERLAQQREQVEYLLQQENDGQLADRQQVLKEMIASGDAPDEAYWQAGYVKKGDEWVSVRDRWLTPDQEKNLAEYTKARSDSVDSDEGHYKLAQWCAENGFQGQAYAHLKAVLLSHPEQAGLRQMLGYQRVGGRWMNAEEYEAAVREADRLAQELQEWGPKVAEIRDGLNSTDPRRQNRAKVQLKEITQVAAVPALELILLPSSDIGAAACVEQLREIKHRRSSIALCKAAMILPESADRTKQTAIEELKTRPLKDFVTDLLSQTSVPMTTQVETHMRLLPNAFVLNLSLVGVSESYLTKDVFVNNEINVFGARYSRAGGHERVRSVGVRASNLGQGEVFRDLLSAQRRNEKRLEDVDARRSDMNRDVQTLLTNVTGIKSHDSVEEWWDWWNRLNDFAVNSKNLAVATAFEVRERNTPVQVVFSSSCFVAGTPVWTDCGPRPIEHLNVGDMALTKDVETGELAYRPVIRRTVREAKELVTIDFGAEHITATGSHPFWVSGEGWVKARDLQAGQLVHTPTGAIKVDGVTPADKAEVYNLIVDGFHTYFVGMSQALCHDISMAPPTDAVVPGLLDR